ncbi:FAD-dependent pyridine nucleotide-disulphide oxidoreductase [Methanococcus vannielii SB]|uniref:FAD-dependent pyridine nucleotide-disulphide oxidoreductase n=1 Tax=Methanococcus vannielii (strain ATCC 35089 / DSM 1224 / JCM 13029 / OCM 148 / SB) TaxID=406327 RepID=A6UNJ0_METVS|nr:F420-dependent thioredoxin reductase [Methanococcus vannielii]ABR54062.1 FAD-dependent pyridine nucleotide-disulphide oxidoreductase [Methanococcus vannielii SB]
MAYDLIIIGGGPAGLTAGIYAMRARLNVLCIEKENEGGKIAEAGIVENYPGFKSIKGFELAEQFSKHAEYFELPIMHEEVIGIDTKSKPYKLTTKNGIYEANSIIIASGSHYKNVGINEDDYLGKGVCYCVMCDAFFFINKEVIVLGRGTSAIMAAYNLKDIVKKITIVTDRPNLKAVEKIMEERLVEIPNLEIIYNAKPVKVVGENKAEGVIVLIDGKEHLIPTEGIFVSYGYVPNTEFLGDTNIELKKGNFINVDKDCKTNVEGIYACGDVTGGILQVSKAVGEGVTAFNSALTYLQKMH